MTKAQIGVALSSIRADILDEVEYLVRQYRRVDEPNPDDMIIQAVDTPARAKARLVEWITEYNSRNDAGTGQIFLNECLVAAGSLETVASLNAQITVLETQAQTMVDNVNNSAWTFDQVADWLEANLPQEASEVLSYKSLPIPEGYVTVWGEPY